jgi:hypothetical protein
MAELRFVRELLGLTEPDLLKIFRGCNSDTAEFQRKVLLQHPKRDLFMPCDPETDVRVPTPVVGSMLSQLEALEKHFGKSTGKTFGKSFLESAAIKELQSAPSVQTFGVAISREMTMTRDAVFNNPGTAFKDILSPEINDKWAIMIQFKPYLKALDVYYELLNDEKVSCQDRLTNMAVHITGMVQHKKSRFLTLPTKKDLEEAHAIVYHDDDRVIYASLTKDTLYLNPATALKDIIVDPTIIARWGLILKIPKFEKALQFYYEILTTDTADPIQKIVTDLAAHIELMVKLQKAGDLEAELA